MRMLMLPTKTKIKTRRRPSPSPSQREGNSSLEFHQPNVPGRLCIFIDDTIIQWRPRRIPDKCVQLGVVSYLLNRLTGARYPPDVPNAISECCKRDLVSIWRPTMSRSEERRVGKQRRIRKVE